MRRPEDKIVNKRQCQSCHGMRIQDSAEDIMVDGLRFPKVFCRDCGTTGPECDFPMKQVRSKDA